MPKPKGDPAAVMADMIGDRDLTHDLLLLGLVVAQLHARSSASSVVSWGKAAHAAVGDDQRFPAASYVLDGQTIRWPGGSLGWLHKVIKGDLPRYERPVEPLEGPGITCMAPTPRKAVCGRRIGSGPRFYEPDPDTGELNARRFCYQHRAVGRALWEEIRSRPEPPTPPANRGGVLARYIDTDWPRLYRWGDPDWTMPPSGPPSARPKLTVLVTDETDYKPTGVRAAAALSLVPANAPG